MATNAEISQRDLRMRSREIMDAVERGETFTVTRDGREIAVLVPIGSRRRFVPTDEFLRLGRGLAQIDEAGFRESLDEMAEQFQDDPYDR